jgi:hypothetical protein
MSTKKGDVGSKAIYSVEKGYFFCGPNSPKATDYSSLACPVKYEVCLTGVTPDLLTI